MTQSLWVAGMIKFIEKKTKTRKQGKNDDIEPRENLLARRTAPISGDAPFFSDIW